jgi:large subunit ribosomal protein L1
MKRGKKYIEKAALVNRETLYAPAAAIKLVKEAQVAKFDETVEIHFKLGIDPRHADQQIRGTVALPNGTGKTIKIVAITKPENIKAVEEAGADYAGSEDIIEKIQGGWFDYDLVIASPDMMAKVGRLGKQLGAKGLMPSPKSGTVTPDVVNAIKEFKSGKIEYRNDKTGIIHTIIGKLSFDEAKLKENFDVIYDVIAKAKPSKSKGVYIQSISISATMGPGVFVEPSQTKWKEN